MVAASFLAVFTGAVVGMGNSIVSGFFAALLCATFALLLSSKVLTWFLFTLTFLVQGTATFFLGTGALGWAATGLAIVLAVRIIAENGAVRSTKLIPPKTSTPSLTVASLFLYLVCFATSFLVNWPPIPQMLSAVKNAIPMLSILLALVVLPWESKAVTRLWFFLIAIAFIQLPVVIYQHFFIASSRAVQGWDSVVGTMGGSQEGGGLNAILVILCLAALAFSLARVKTKLSSPALGWVTATVVLAVITLGEVKAAFIWMPLVFLYFYGRSALTNPAKATAYAALAALVMTLIFLAYQQMYWQGNKLSGQSVGVKIEKMSSYFFDPNDVNHLTGEVSRGASLALWWSDSKETIVTRTIGYGPGASKSVSKLGQGEVAARFTPLNIDATSAAVFLWDTGVLGFLAYTGMMFFAFFEGRALLKKRMLDPSNTAVLDAAVVTIALMMSLIIYNRTLTDQPIVQLLLYFAIGTVLGLRKQAR